MKNTQDTPLGFVLNLFLSLPEPRRRYCRVYPLEMLLFCAMATFITGRKSFYDMILSSEYSQDIGQKTLCPLPAEIQRKDR